MSTYDLKRKHTDVLYIFIFINFKGQFKLYMLIKNDNMVILFAKTKEIHVHNTNYRD
jgi:hypothetical protein